MVSAFDSGQVRYRKGGEFFFWGFALFALLVLLGWNAFRGSEGRWAEAIRQMLLSGNYIKQALLEKNSPSLLPAGAWLTCPFACKGGMNEFFFRLPSVLLALAGLLCTRIFSARLGGKLVSRCTGWLLLGSYGFLFWGRLAADDILNMTVSAFILMLFFRKAGKPLGGISVFLIVAACVFGITAKGWTALTVPVCMMLPFFSVDSFFRVWNLRKAAVIFLMVLLLFGGGLFVLAHFSRDSGGIFEILRVCFWENFSGAVCRVVQERPWNWEDWYGCFIHLPRLLLPWDILSAVSLAGLLSHWKQLSPELKKMLQGYALAFGVLILLPEKNWYHQLPLLPVTLFFTAEGLLTEFGKRWWNRAAERLLYYIFLVCSSIGVATLVALPLWNNLLLMPPPRLLTCSLPAAGALMLLVCWQCRRGDNFWEPLVGLPHSLGGTVLAGTILMTGLLCVVLPATGTFRTGKPFYQSLRRAMDVRDCEELIVFKREIGADGLFYLGLDHAPLRADSSAELDKLWKKLPQGAAVLAERGDVKKIQKFLKKQRPDFSPEKPDCAEAVTVRFDGKVSVPEDGDWVVWFLLKENKDTDSWKQGEKNAEQ